jgi:hypothetical protein
MIDPTTIQAGATLNYNDGRPGHTNVKAKVLSVYSNGMVVQFEDRAEPNTILFSDHDWMDNLTLAQ